jgi:hypothetical protein
VIILRSGNASRTRPRSILRGGVRSDDRERKSHKLLRSLAARRKEDN